jgi:hypothetical protein
MVEDRAEHVARESILGLVPPAAVEGESLSCGELEIAIQELRRKLLDGKRPRLWG